MELYISGGYYGSIETRGTSFENNAAKAGAGGAMYIAGLFASVVNHNTTFTNNVGCTGGGAIFVSNVPVILYIFDSQWKYFYQQPNNWTWWKWRSSECGQ